MDILLDALFGMVAGRGRQPKMDPFVAVAGAVFALLTALLFHGSLFDGGTVGLVAWLAIPMAATYLVATLFGRPYAIRGALLAGGMALILALPLAVLELMFGLWS